MEKPDPQTKIFIVLGYDTFSREDYIAGASFSEERARELLKLKETQAAETQDESLRDTYTYVCKKFEEIENTPYLASSLSLILNYLEQT